MALTDAIGGVLKGVLGTGPVGAPDLSQLFAIIDSAGANQRNLINALPDALQKQYQAYKDANAAAGTNLQGTTEALTKGLTEGTAANYDPNAPAVVAAEDAAKRAIYGNLPGQQNAIRQALAATGGFDRGTASKQLAAPVLQAGQQYTQQVANITASQLQQKQAATQKALETVTGMGEDVAQKLFGMSTQQATAILQGNRQDLKDQLTSLINQSVNQANQTLGVTGTNIQNQYNQQVAENAQKNAETGAWIDLGTNLVSSAIPGFTSALGVSAPANYNPNMAPNQAAVLGY